MQFATCNARTYNLFKYISLLLLFHLCILLSCLLRHVSQARLTIKRLTITATVMRCCIYVWFCLHSIPKKAKHPHTIVNWHRIHQLSLYIYPALYVIVVVFSAFSSVCLSLPAHTVFFAHAACLSLHLCPAWRVFITFWQILIRLLFPQSHQILCCAFN